MTRKVRMVQNRQWPRRAVATLLMGIIAPVSLAQNAVLPVTVSAAKLAAYEAQLAAAEASWGVAKIEDYAYQLREGGRARHDTYRVRVMQGDCSATMRTTLKGRAGPWQAASCEGHRIEDQFARFREALQSGVRRAYVEFDARFGFIANLAVETARPSASGFWYVEMIQFSRSGTSNTNEARPSPVTLPMGKSP